MCQRDNNLTNATNGSSTQLENPALGGLLQLATLTKMCTSLVKMDLTLNFNSPKHIN